MSTPQPKRNAGPEWEPVSLREAKQQLKIAVNHKAHDQELLRLIQAGREEAERDTSIVAAASDFTIVYPSFPVGPFRMPFHNVTAVTELKYTDGTTETVIDPSEYTLITALVTPELWTVSNWPATPNYPYPITMSFTAGAATPEEVDPGLKSMVLSFVDIMFNYGADGELKTEGLGRVYESLRLGRVATYP